MLVSLSWSFHDLPQRVRGASDLASTLQDRVSGLATLPDHIPFHSHTRRDISYHQGAFYNMVLENQRMCMHWSKHGQAPN